MQHVFDLINAFQLVEKELTLKRGEVLVSPGTTETNIYWITSGTIKVSIFDEDEERIVRFGYKNDLVVALDSFLTTQPTDFLMQAIKQTEIRVISHKKWISFLEKDLKHQQIWTELLQVLVVQQIEREKDLLIQSPKLRLECVLKRSPALFQEIPKRYIANYLRMAPETLSRLKNLD